MKKILSLSLVLIMFMALVGCSSNDAPDPGSTGKSKPITLEDYENIEIGTTAEDIREKFGEPEFTTLGTWVETYHYADQSISISYETNADNYGTVTGVYFKDIEEDGQQTGGTPNPFSKVENNEVFNEVIGINIDAPEGATNIEYSIYSNEIVQINYDYGEKRFVLRASKTISGRELSGKHGDFEMMSYVSCGEHVSVTVDTVEIEDGSAFATSTVEMLDNDTVYLALSTTNQITGNEISSMIDAMSYKIADTTLSEIVGDTRLLTEEELAFFNDNYFDILYEEEGYHIRFSEGTRMGDEVKLIYRGYVPETGDAYEMIEHIITLQQEGESYIYISYEPAV